MFFFSDRMRKSGRPLLLQITFTQVGLKIKLSSEFHVDVGNKLSVSA